MLYIIVTGNLVCNSHETQNKSSTEFINSVEDALQLTPVYSTYLYKNPHRLIVNDTIVGFHSYFAGDPIRDGDYFYIQSLQNPKNIKRIYSDKVYRGGPVQGIDQFKDGCINFISFGGATMESICNDGFREYFPRYGNGHHAKKLWFYKNKTIMLCMNGVFFYDNKSQKLLWQYKFPDGLDRPGGALIGEKFVFTENDNLNITELNEASTVVHCVNVDKLNFIWIKRLPKGEVSGPSTVLPHDKQYFAFTTSKPAFYVLKADNGTIEYHTSIISEAYFSGEYLYISPVGGDTYKMRLSDKRVLWRAKGRLIGTHKKFVMLGDEQAYLIYDEVNGKLLSRIFRPEPNNMTIDLIGKYVLLNREHLYK